jgi:hypothetical protein
MPEPAANPTWTRASLGAGATPKRPVGVMTSSSSPRFNSCATQLENAPPSIFFTAMRNSPSSGPEQIE